MDILIKTESPAGYENGSISAPPSNVVEDVMASLIDVNPTDIGVLVGEQQEATLLAEFQASNYIIMGHQLSMKQQQSQDILRELNSATVVSEHAKWLGNLSDPDAYDNAIHSFVMPPTQNISSTIDRLNLRLVAVKDNKDPLEASAHIQS